MIKYWYLKLNSIMAINALTNLILFSFSPETTDSQRLFQSKVSKLAKMMQEAKHIVVLTGAGISTSAGSKSSETSWLLLPLMIF